MAKLVNLIDAPHDVLIRVELEHVLEAIGKGRHTYCGSDEERKFGCAMEVAFLSQYPEFRGIKVDSTVARAMFVDESKPTWRWILDNDGKKLADINDLNMKELLRRVKMEPIEVRFVSPIAVIVGEDNKSRMKRYTRSLKWNRSEEGKQAKRESAERREGMEPRDYSEPKGVTRSGRYADSFFVRDDK